MTDPDHEPLEPESSAPWAEEEIGEAPAGEAEEGSALADYKVRLPAFEGPLDLLLHLIRVNEIDIYNIPIAEITRQYEAYLDLMRDLSLEVAGDYLVVAATLVYIKSKMILPAPPEEAPPEEDPRAELRDRLLEYERFKQAAAGLALRDDEARRIWGVGAPPPESSEGETMLEVSLFDLISAFQRVLSSIGEDQRLEFRRDTLRVADAMARINEMLDFAPALLLEELFLRQSSRAERIVSFLAILELMRLQAVRATQARRSGQILLWRRAPLLLAAPDAPARSSHGKRRRAHPS